jgi:peptidyl-prolyl cis-trans isomerase B (cyclophilin B)
MNDATDPDHPARPAQPSPAGPQPNPRIMIETSEGQVLVELWPDAAPRTVEHFLALVHNGFYDGLTFHRVVPGFVVQGGCPHGDGTGGAGYTIQGEFNDRPHDKGTLSMARTADPNSASSQFFICLSRENCRHLDGQYTAFGQVVDGLDTVDRLAATPLSHPDIGTPLHAPQILHCYRIWDQPAEAI